MAYGQGTLKQATTGKWRARYWGPDGRQHQKSFATKTEARNFLASVQTDKRRGSWIDPKLAQVRFDLWAEEWFRGQHGLGDHARYRDGGLLRKHVISRFGPTAVGKITPLDVRAWVNDLVASGLAPRTVHACYTIFGRVMKAAVAAKMIADAPVGRGVVALPTIERKPERFLTELELERLVDQIDPYYRPLVLTAAYTGCRWQELAGLKRSNLDLPAAQLHVRTVTKRLAGGKVEIRDEPKTSSGRRTISLNRHLVEMLTFHLKSAPESGLVFPSRKGGIIATSGFRQRHWNPAADRAGLDGFTFHDLRHTHVAWLIQSGAQPIVVQRRLGHKDIGTTMNVYGHLFPNAEESIVDDLDRRWSASSGLRVVS